jgi:XTP/dITP diphosphohydrolase
MLCHGPGMTTLILATRNDHKVAEIQAILGDQFFVRTLRDFASAPDVAEDAGSFAGNATKKAVALARHVSAVEAALCDGAAFVLADDSGLEVDALQGAPGVNSARFAGRDTGAAGNSSDAANNAKLLRSLQNVPEPERTARFRCVLALVPLLLPVGGNASPVCAADEHELATELFDGTCEGRIGLAASGANGFGYDPLFIPAGFEKSFAALGDDVKRRISHRARALEKLRARLAGRCES